MSEQDRYIPGVPCWIDTTQPDPDAAAAFYGEPVRLGVRGRHAARSRPAGTTSAGIGGGDVAAVGSQPEGGAADRRLEHLRLGRGRRRDRCQGPRRRRRRAQGAERRRGRRGAWRSSPTRAAPTFCVWQPKEHRGAAVVNEHGSLNFNDLNTRDLERARRVLRRRLRLGAARRRRGIHVGPARLRRLPRGAQRPDMRENMADDGRARAIRGGRRERHRDPRRSGRHPGALGRDVRRRRRRRDRRARGRARRPGARPAVRRAVGAHDGHQPTRRARRSRPASSCRRTRTSPQSAGAATGA